MTSREIFSQIIHLSDIGLLNCGKQFLEKHNYKNITMTSDYLFAEGQIPIVLVAHVDTVFGYLPSEIYYDSEKDVMWSPDGLGADDRAGVAAIFKIIADGYRPSVILTNGEERLVEGATALVTDHITCPFKQQMKYMIELDRQGSIDCVFYSCLNHDFKDYVCMYGFVENFGSYSDISILCRDWNIAGVNLSTGYYDEHSTTERLKFKELDDTITRVKVMLNDAETAPTFTYETFLKCSCCGKSVSTYDLDFVTDENGIQNLVCWDCISVQPNIQYCDKCLELYITDDYDAPRICPSCREKYKRINYG